MTCGIYQIVNKVNGKSYVGQSRKIENRWKQHKSGLHKPNALESGNYPLRAAFLKYGLEQFEFKIIEECNETDLLIREKSHIDSINPEYNCNVWTPAKKKKIEKTGQKIWIQYHNYNKLGYLPGEAVLDEWDKDDLENDVFLAGVSTGKRAVLNAKGDTVFLIVGVGDNPKQYYLMYKFIIEEIQIREDVEIDDGEKAYDAFGDGSYIDPPQLLNSPITDSSDFDAFKKYCGNFAFGFMAPNSNNSPYLKTLEDLSEKHKAEKVIFSKYVEDLYSNILAINPDEISAREKKGIARHLALSLYPDDAALIVTGVNTKIVVFDITELVVRYRGKLLIHTLNFYEDFDPELRPQFQESCLKILNALELDEETFPAHALQGWVTVENIFKYDKESFAADQDAHGQGENLDTYCYERGFSASDIDVWCIEFSQPGMFEDPVPLVEPKYIQENDLWLPVSETEVKAFKKALEHWVDED